MAKTDEAGSDKAELKKWLKRADAGPIHMAFAFAKDGSAMLKLDGMKQGRALEKTLKEGSPDSKNHRFGTVAIDPDNPKIVKFFVNKAVGGAANKLSKALKGTGFTKVQLVMDDGSVEEAESEDEGEDEDKPDPPALLGAAVDGGTSSDTNTPTDTLGADPSPPSFDPADTGYSEPQYADPVAAPDAATLTKQLTDLVKQMLGAIKKDPTQKAALAELATDAQASLKRGDLETAAAGLEILRQAIADATGQDPSADATDPAAATAADPAVVGAAPPAGDTSSANADAATLDAGTSGSDSPASPADTGAVTKKLQKSRAVWSATRSKIESDLQKLDKAVQDSAQGDQEAAELKKLLTSVIEPVMSNLDESLSDVLDRAASAQDPAERRKLLAEVNTTIKSYQQFIQGSPMLDHLDSNPFVPLNLVKMLTASLAAVTSAVN